MFNNLVNATATNILSGTYIVALSKNENTNEPVQ